MGMVLSDISNATQMTNAHKRCISNFVEMNPRLSLAAIAKQLNGLPEMMTCHVSITAAVLKDMGYAEPDISSDAGDDSIQTGGGYISQLNIETLRKQLEKRHDKIQARIEMLLDEDSLSSGQLKTVESLAKIDDTICNKLMDLMNQEATPILPQAIIISCMRRHGVPDEDILVIEDLRIA